MKEVKDKSKLDNIAHEGGDIKEYMESKSINQVRDLFRIRTHMVKGFKANFKNMYRDTECEGCHEMVDSQSHAMICSAYEDLRDGVDLSQDVELISYFKKVLDRREM